MLCRIAMPSTIQTAFAGTETKGGTSASRRDSNLAVLVLVSDPSSVAKANGRGPRLNYRTARIAMPRVWATTSSRANIVRSALLALLCFWVDFILQCNDGNVANFKAGNF